MKSLGYSPAHSGCLITPSGSTSLLCVTNWLKQMEIMDVDVLCPVYFTFLHAAQNMNIKLKFHYLKREKSGYVFPDSIFNSPPRKAIWVTNPVYCTGVPLQENDISYLNILQERGIFILADECLSMSGMEVSHKGILFDQLIGIYAPHKGICVNGSKFSSIIYPRKYDNFFEQWSDVLYGCLANSNALALEHYLNGEFKEYENLFLDKLYDSSEFVKSLCIDSENIDFDKHTKGPFLTCYARHLNGKYADQEAVLWEIISSTGVTFIPGIRNHFDPNIGMCFRVNLTRDCTEFRYGLKRLIDYLDQIKVPAHQKALKFQLG